MYRSTIKNSILKSALYIILMLSTPLFSQNNIHDLTYELEDKTGGWAIGNACGVEPYMYVEFPEGLDMKGEKLQVMYSHILIVGELINQGELIYTCDKAIIEFKEKPLSIENPNIKQLKVFPNPAENEINIQGIEVQTLQLYDISGRLLKDFKTVGKLHRIMINDLQSGVYLLKINHFNAKKIVKL